MSVPRAASPAKLIVGLFMKDQELFEPASHELGERFGPIESESSWFPFDFTEYYCREMGCPLFRKMLVFQNTIRQDELADIKLFTNTIEDRYKNAGQRRINIDPGYLTAERLVLATGKNFTHRIYLGKGIYADLTLIYSRGDFQALPWTYPDYQDNRMTQFLKQVRERHLFDLKRGT